MEQTVTLMSAPTSIQPGGYVPVAYADRTEPVTRHAEVTVEPIGHGWSIALGWDCPDPVRDIARETDRFVDACAVFAPETAQAPWITMGAAGMAVQGWLWRADKASPLQVRAEGLGTMERSAAPTGTQLTAEWAHGRWRVVLTLPEWPALASQRRMALAIWRGAAQERAGLKSVSPDWIAIA